MAISADKPWLKHQGEVIEGQIEVANNHLGTYKFDCAFKAYSTEEYSKQYSDPLKLLIAVDFATDKATLIGNNGHTDVKYVYGPYGFTFIEVIGTGAMHMLTITNVGNAVYSRHTIASRPSNSLELVPTQSYGFCEMSPL